jgi:hypothetical protein
MQKCGREVLNNILSEFSIPIKLAKQIKMRLNKAYSRVQVGKNLPDMFPIKNGFKQQVASTFLLFNFALDYTIRMVHASHEQTEVL